VHTDTELVGIVRAGGEGRERAWNELLEKHTPRMYGVARSFDLDPATAEDLVQTAWLRLLERTHQLRDAELVGAWLCTIVRNEARRLVTRRRAIPVADGWDRVEATQDPADARLVHDERTIALRSAFAKLGPECRQLLKLLLVDPPLSYDEISSVLGRPRGSLGPTRQRCIEQVRKHLPAGVDEW
jgi:RNA polymerase sigma factor (sigma-70 family)